jgi:hypothetical protein
MTQSDGQQQAALMKLVKSIVAGDAGLASQLLSVSPDLASAAFHQGATRENSAAFFLIEIGHYIYAGDTALHLAAAAHRHKMMRKLIGAGADVRAKNRRGATPLHYAADGMPGSPSWNPRAQALAVARLIDAGADPDASDSSGVTPLHRAVRTRCAPAVRALLEGGADAKRENRTGSTPMQLSIGNTGRSGAGSPEAKAQQAEIVGLLKQHGALA